MNPSKSIMQVRVEVMFRRDAFVRQLESSNLYNAMVFSASLTRDNTQFNEFANFDALNARDN